MIAWEKEKRDNLKRIIKKYSTNAVDPQQRPPEAATSREFGCSEFLEDFCCNSTIHGIKYMGDRKRHWTERLWWLVAFVLSIYGCTRLILHIWDRWDRSPVIVSFAEKTTEIWKIPFPSVTICPETKTQADLFNFTEMHYLIQDIDFGRVPNTLTQEQLWQIDAVLQICEPSVANTTVGTYHTTTKIVNILQDLTPRLPPTLFLCRWHNEPVACAEIFSQILTEEGICFTFNNLEQGDIFREENLHTDFRYIEESVDVTDWSVEEGYPPHDSLNTYPERVQMAGARAGLYIILPLNNFDKDYMCRGPTQGFKVQIHAPGEIPRLSQQYFRLSLDKEIIISVKPNMITTSKVLKEYPINRRMCYFQKERYLRFFKLYTQQNCELECLTNYTLHKCGCVKFSMPRDKKTKMCGAKNMACINQAEGELFNPYEGDPGQETGCDCLPACTSLSYDAETSQADFDWREYLQALGAVPGSFPGDQLARITIFFRDSQFITSKRSELYGPTDFLANCGGLLGLFMGVSILSIVEVVYFLTLRVWYAVQKFKKARRSTARGDFIVNPT